MSTTPAAPKGGQKSAPVLVVDTAKVSPEAINAIARAPLGPVEFVTSPDRIDTPDGVNVAAVLEATAKIERERHLAEALRTRHMSSCPTTRNQECSCPANLHQGYKALEVMKHALGEIIRVDDGRDETRMVPDPTSPRGATVKETFFVLPRWVCMNCGWAARCLGVNGHACDEALLVWKARPVPLSATVSRDKRFSGGYRLTVWRDIEGKYHLGEVVIEHGQVIQETVLTTDGYYPSIEGELHDKILSEFES